MAIAQRRPRRRQAHLLLGLSLALIAALVSFIGPQLRAASVLLQLQDPSRKSWAASIGSNAVETHLTTIAARMPVRARVYRPVGYANAPEVIVFHGVHHLGIDEPRLVAFAEALASHGFLVVTPELRDLADYHFTPRTIETIGECAHSLRQSSGRPVGIVGLSFAGGLSLMAASRPEWRDDISLVAAIGAHDDLRRVMDFFVTNRIDSPRGTTTEFPAHEYGPLVVVYSHPEEFFSTRDVAGARAALRYLLWEDVDRARAEAAHLSRKGRQQMQLLFEHRTQMLAPALLREIRKYQDELIPVSPHGALTNLQAAVYLLHGAGDNIIPASETEWLERDLPEGCVRAALISPAISHLDMRSSPSWADELKLVNFISELLRDAASPRPARREQAPVQSSYFRTNPSLWSH